MKKKKILHQIYVISQKYYQDVYRGIIDMSQHAHILRLIAVHNRIFHKLSTNRNTNNANFILAVSLEIDQAVEVYSHSV